MIPIGLASATLSSAIGSLLVAPRTLQALGNDQIFPFGRINRFLSRGRGDVNEPVNATLVTAVVVIAFVSMGGVDFVAQIISMFFMITYGAICSISFLEHFAGNPSYRPTFKSKWYLSLIGAVGCFVMMIAMQPLYAVMAFVLMIVTYLWLKRSRKGERDLSEIVKGVLFQITRMLQVLIQKQQPEITATNWRPSVLAISASSLKRLAPFDLLRWISYHYGFGTFIHYKKGILDARTSKESKDILGRLIAQTLESDASIYVDTIISPSFRTAVAQMVQIPGLAGMENNSVLFEIDEDDPSSISDILDGCEFASVVGYNIFVQRSSERHFGYKRHIHVWITSRDLRNANLKIILAYIIMGHPDWKGSEITLFVALGAENQEGEVVRLNDLIANGRIPISRNNVVQINNPERLPFDKVVSRHSVDADLVITGFSLARLKKDRGAFFKKFEGIADILFVRAGQDILITDGTAASPELRDDGLDPVVEVFEGEESGDLEESTG